MFGFKKKKPDKKDVVQELTPEEIENLKKQANELAAGVDSLTADDQPKQYEALGAVYTKLGQTDDAIGAYEASLRLKEQFGDAYNALLNLYETKRKEAAAARDDAEIQKWVTKTDTLLDMSKRVLRSSMF
jgi:tetratricopeptide (TPR) repeat protein